MNIQGLGLDCEVDQRMLFSQQLIANAHREVPLLQPFQAVVFDLDGTLLDTLDDIAAATNAVLQQMSLPQHPRESYKHFVGQGVRVLFEQVLPEEMRTLDVIEECVAMFETTYDAHWDVLTRPYDGIPELLTELVQRGLPLAVLSNKPHAFTMKCVERFLAQWPWAVVMGQRDEVPRKPDPAGALAIAAQIGVEPATCLYVGDTNIDMQTAVAAGMYPLGVAWGFRSVEELRAHGAAAIIDTPAELLQTLSLRSSAS